LIPNLAEIASQLGLRAAFVPVFFAGLFTTLIFVLEFAASWLERQGS
jgi:hypothetical protein